jgi:hypothetical protein
MTSRSVSLTSTFLMLAAGGAAACDSGKKYHDEGFYCADEQGRIVDEDFCDDNRVYSGAHPYYIYHSPNYGAALLVGSLLPLGGSRFAYNDRTARSSFGLPSTGRIGNGTVKTSVVGKGGSGSSSHTSGKSGS